MKLESFKKLLRSLPFATTLLCFTLLCILPNYHIAKANDVKTFDDGTYTYQIASEAQQTVTLTGSIEELSQRNVIFPSQVEHNGIKYTITSIQFDAMYRKQEQVQTLTFPDTIVDEVSFFNQSQFDESDFSFPNLTKVTFTGTMLPSKINLSFTVTDHDILIEVPAGQETMYESLLQPLHLLVMDSLDLIDGDDTYTYMDIKPVVISSVKTDYEPTVFSNENGTYLVTESGVSKTGEVKLLYAKKAIIQSKYTKMEPMRSSTQYWGESTFATDVTFNNNYHYTVTSLATGSLRDIKTSVLSIPDTITSIDEYAINPKFLKAIFLSKNCTTLSDRIFGMEEEDAELALVYVPSTVKTIESDAFSGIHADTILLSKLSSANQSMLKKQFTNIIYFSKQQNDVVSNALTAESTITTYVGTPKQLSVKATNSKSTDTIRYISLDNGTALVSKAGKVTPKHNGNGYILAYSTLSGEHTLIRVKVKDRTFTRGIFTYRINYSKTNDVTVIECKPNKNTKTITIPSSVTYKGTKYSVTQVLAGKSILDSDFYYDYTGKNGYPRTYDYETPLISDSIAKNSKLEKIIIPSSVTLKVGFFGNLKNLKTITFKGNKAPSLLILKEASTNNITLEVPKKAVANYKKTKYFMIGEDYTARYDGWSKKLGLTMKTY